MRELPRRVPGPFPRRVVLERHLQARFATEGEPKGAQDARKELRRLAAESWELARELKELRERYNTTPAGARLPEDEGTYEFVARELYQEGGAGPEFRLPVTVTRPLTGPGSTQDDTLGWTVVASAGIVLLLAAVAALGLRRRRRRA